MRHLCALAAAALLLGACDQLTGTKAGDESPTVAAVSSAASGGAASRVAEDIIPSEVAVPASVPENEDIMTGLASGNSATLRLTCGPDSDIDQMLGAVMCGESYTVFYEAATSRWAAIGPNRALVAAGAQDPRAGAKNPGPPPSEGVVIVWGLNFTIGADGAASLGSGDIAGQLTRNAV